MRTKTKIPLTQTEIETVMEAAFSTTVDRTEELSDGMFNAAYRVDLADGESVFLKAAPLDEIPVMRYEHGLIQTEAQVYGLIREETQIPVPELLHVDFSRSLIDRDYLITTFLHGLPWNQVTKQDQKEHITALQIELGRCLGQLHQIEGSGFGYFSDLTEPAARKWDTAFLRMVDRALSDGEDMQVRLPYGSDRIRSIFSANQPFLAEVSSPRLAHFDIWAGNVFVRQSSSGYKVEGIVDCERAFWGDPYADFVSNFALFNDVEYQPHFQKGYHQAFGASLVFSESTRRRLKLYRAYLILLMLIEMPFRDYPWHYRIIHPLLTWELRKNLKALKI